MSRRTFQLGLLTWLVLAQGWLLAAAVQVGGVLVHLPAPAGCVQYEGRQRRADLLQSGMIPEGNRLLAAFAERDEVRQIARGELPRWQRAYSAQVWRSLEEVPITAEVFAALQKTLREQVDGSKKRLALPLGTLESRASTILSQQVGERVQVRLGTPKPLGVFAETPESLCWSMEVPSVMNGAALEYPVDSLSIVASCILPVSGRVIFLQVSSALVEDSDMEWVQQQIVQWRDQVVSANARDALYVDPPEEDLLADDTPLEPQGAAGTPFSRRVRVILAALAAAVLTMLLRALWLRRGVRF